MKPENLESVYGLSPTQEGILFHALYEPKADVYFLQIALRVHGDLDVPLLRQAWEGTVARHPVLRTAIHWQGMEKPVQVVYRRVDLPWEEEDWRALPEEEREERWREFRRADRERGFDLSRAPLLRVTLIRTADDLRYFVWSFHHILIDGWCLPILFQEVFARYVALRRGESLRLPPAQPYRDYIAWLQRQDLGGAEAFWRQYLDGFTTPTPLAADRPAGAPGSGWELGDREVALSESLSTALAALARRNRLTPNMLLQGAWALLLGRYGNAGDVVFGATFSGRSGRLPGIETMIGLFINTLPVRIGLAPEAPLASWLEGIQERHAQLLQREYTPLVDVQRWSSAPRGVPLFESLLVFENYPVDREAERLAGVPFTVEVASQFSHTNYPLTLIVFGGERMVLRLKYATDRFDEEAMVRRLGHLERLLEGMTALPGARLSDLPLLSAAERRQLLEEWQEPAPAGVERTLPELFAEQLERAPHRVAVVGEGESWTYAELAARANRLAHHLLALGVRPGGRVALCLERSPDLVAAILGVLSTGAAYVPIDPVHPEERRLFGLTDSAAAVLVTAGEAAEAWESLPAGVRVVRLDRADLESASAEPPRLALSPDLPAYVIYTSGSTGRPKGVVVTHRNVARLFAAARRRFDFGADDVWTLFHSYAFDFAVWEMWGALLHGGRLVVVPYWTSRSPRQLGVLLRREGVTVLNQTPSAFHAWVAEAEEEELGGLALRWVIFGGEALAPASLGPWFERQGDEHPRLVNMYGITETTVHVTWRRLRRADLGAASVIGRPLPGWRVHLLGGGLEPLPVGIPGEIWVGGGGLATAYLGRPELTAERFVPDPFATAGEAGGRLYRSGDLARRRPDGELEYLGRIDRQVKIRGFRVELGEIEAALVRHPAIREAVVEARADRLGEPSLVAYLVPSGGDPAPDLAALRSFLAASLPEAMLPAAAVVLDVLPLTANGKVDRRALPEPDARKVSVQAEPRTELERFLAGLWRDALGVERIGLEDDFFAGGGNSISGARLINRLQKRLGEIVHVVAIFDAPTVAAFAAYLVREHSTTVARIFGGDSPAEGSIPTPEPVGEAIDEAALAELRRLIPSLPSARVETRNPRAVFLLSPPRSGSTLLRVMLAGHPRLFAPPELELLSFDTLAERRTAFAGRDAFWLEGLIRAVMEAQGLAADAAREVVAGWEAEGLSTLAAYGRLQASLGDRLLVDKTPSYSLSPSALRRIEEAFEAPFYLHLVRHPNGMIRSFEEARLDQIFFRRDHPFSRRQLAELIWTDSHRNLLEVLAGVPAERQLRVRFEDLLADPARVVGEICERLDLRFDPSMVQPYGDQKSRMTDGLHAESRMLGDVKFSAYGRIDPGAADRWRVSHPEDRLGAPTRELAAALGYALSSLTPGPVAGREERSALSFAQERLWFLDRLAPGSPAYNIAAAVRLSGRLEVGTLAAALAEISRRHAVLRSRFEEVDGQPWQRISPDLDLPLPVLDLAGLPAAGREAEVRRLAAMESSLGFDLTRGPLLRVRLLRLAETEHAALFTLHHIVSDGWSMGILVHEVGALYAAFVAGLPSPLPPLPLQYADFARWQRGALAAEALDAQFAYWRERLAGAPEELALPVDHPRPAVASGLGGEIPVRLPAGSSAALAQRGATPFMVLLAGWKALLYRLSGQSDVVVGTPVANRNRAEIEGLIGFFVNTLVLRTDLSGGRLSFRELVERVRETAVGAFAHQDLPFERLVEALAPERTLARTPLFQVMFALQNAPVEELAMPGLTLEPLAVENRTTKFDLSLLLAERGGEVAGSLTFSRDLFEPASVTQWLRAYGALLSAAAADPSLPVAELSLWSRAERDQVLAEWSDTPVPAASLADVHTLFVRQAERSLEAVALRHGGETTTYSELAGHTARLGRALRRFGVEPETVVGLLAGRSPEAVTGLLGVLAAGGCLLPLEVELPAERLAFLLRDAGAVAVLTTRRDGDVLPLSVDLPVLILEDLLATPDESVDTLSAVPLEAAAYVLYTSGSTGRPKGVVIEQRSLANYLLWVGGFLAGQGVLALPAIARLSFDAFLKQLLAPLLRGGEVWLPAGEAASDPDLLLTELGSREGTAFNGVPALWRPLLERIEAGQDPPATGTLRFVLFGGDRVFPDLAERTFAALPQVAVWNSYGPTEATANATAGPLLAGERISLGRPIAGCRLAVLDPVTLQPLPPSLPGELCLGGPGIARGYRGMPALTAERFIPDPFAPWPGERLYRTGDRVRLRPDGGLEFLGRLDDQIKVRGVRVEPGEVEAALAAHPGVAESAIATARVADGEALAAWIVPRAGAAPTASDLRDFLRHSLPEALVPSFFTLVAALPRTTSRKLDRRALAALPLDAPAVAATAPPRGPVEEILAGIWEELFQRSGLGDEDFFTLGGHSLLAVRLASRIRKAFGVELPLRSIFEHSSLAGLAAKIDELARDAADEAPLIRVPREGAMPLSFPQRRLWILDRIAPGLATYNIPLPLLLEGGVDTVALAGVLDEILRRHEVLRTRFATDGEGEPCQIVEPAGPLPLPRVDLRGLPARASNAELERLALEEATRPFDLDRAPLLRAILVDLAGSGARQHALLLTLHHIAADGWSLEILLREAEALYAARTAGLPASLPELPVQYADYAVWQRRHLQGDHLAGLLGYWRQRLAGALPFELPADRPRPAIPGSRGGQVRLRLEPALSGALKELARHHRATLFMVTLSAFEALLWQRTGRADGVIGSPSANRDRREIESLIGFFVNMLVLRGEVAAGDRFPDLLARTRESALGAYAHRDLPFERLVEEVHPERAAGRNPLFQIMFQLLPATPRPPLSSLGVRRLDLLRGTTQFDLGLSLVDTGAEIEGALEYAVDLYDRTTLVRLAEHLQGLLAALAANPGIPLAALPRLGAAEAHQVTVEWNDTGREGGAGGLVHRLFERWVAAAPDATALLHGDERVSYGELNRRANRLAHRLRREGVGPEVPVAVFLDRSPELVTAFLSILKAGGAYVPLDPGYPEERLALLLADTGAPLVLTSTELRERLPAGMAARLLLAGDSSDGGLEDAADPDPGPLSGASLAYVLYTSGSTGRPKGVAVPHEAIVRLARGGGFADLGPEQVFLQLAPTSFDASTLEIWGPLLNGGRLAIPPAGTLSLEEIGQALSRFGVTTLWLTSGLFRLMVDQNLEGLRPVRQLLAGGDVLPLPQVSRLLDRLPECRLINGYGPTENTTFTTCHPIVRRDLGRGTLPVGRPIGGTRVRILDAGLAPVAVGSPGELFAGGLGLARGYFGRPDLTAERFVPDPDPRRAGERLYRTGDLARWLPDGSVEFLGRIDTQVKIRGFRIEPGEVEAALAALPGVRAAAVGVRPDAEGEKRLVAWVVPSDGGIADTELRVALRRGLPDFMVPALFVPLAALPLTPNGKVDRNALPEPAAAGSVGGGAPRTPLEELLAGLWTDLLGVPAVGAEDDFFALGGHSLLAVQFVSRVRETCGVEVSLRSVFERPTLSAMAAEVERALRQGGGLEAPPIVPVAGDQPIPLSFAQQRLWILDQMEIGLTAYNLPLAVRLTGRLQREALRGSLGEIVRRHAALRTGFGWLDGAPVQVVTPWEDLALPIVDLSALPAERGRAAARRLAVAEAALPFSLEWDPLLRLALVALAAEEHVLLLTLHHIIADGWSLGVVLRELAALYPAALAGRPAVLPELPVQYADYSVWQQRWFAGEVLEREVAWWRRALDGAPVLELPTDRPHRSVHGFAGGSRSAALPRPISEGLARLCRAVKVTPFMALLGAWTALLARYSGQLDVVVGSPVANRDRLEIEGLVGFFVNTLVLRVRLDGGSDVRGLLARVRETALGAFAHQEMPFQKLVEELQPQRSLQRSPFFQVFFTLQNAPLPPAELPGLTLAALPVDSGTSKFELSLAMAEGVGGWVASIEHNRELFDPATAERLLRHFQSLLATFVAEPARALSELPLLSLAERQQLFGEWNDTEWGNWRGAQLHRVFERTVAARPEAIALLNDERRISYGDLNGRANRLARVLRRLGVGPEVAVGVYLDSSPELVIAYLAVLKAGGAYVPLSTAYPRERLEMMVEETAAPVVLTRDGLRASVPASRSRVLAVDGDESLWAGEDGSDLPGGATGDGLAYIMYTSGSTGRPKGVAVVHEGIVRLVRDAGFFTATPEDVFLQITAISFDVSTFEIWGALLNGSRLSFLSSAAFSLDEVGQAVNRHDVSVLFLTSGLFGLLVDRRLDDLRRVRQFVAGGDIVPVPQARRVVEELPGCRMINGYGPTENTTFTTWRTVTAADAARPSIPIGGPIGNTRVYVLDAEMRPVPIGVRGELLTGGIGLARGYYRRPDLTAERFVPDPLAASPGERVYRTGDFARWLPDGGLEFLGRMDVQVKIRGFRIELGEVETTLGRHPDVAETVVVAREDRPGDRRLVAYLVTAGDATPAVADLQAFLRRTLPDYMVPAAFVAVDALPLTAAGKVDRAALPAPDDAARESQASYVPPRTNLERTIAGIWSEVLRVERIGVNENFFDLGGHSLLLLQAVSRLNEALGRELPKGLMFEHPTVAALAGVLGESGATEPAAVSLEPSQERAAARRESMRQRRRGPALPAVPAGGGREEDDLLDSGDDE
jgi:amino acid adenylation domain-containing protein